MAVVDDLEQYLLGKNLGFEPFDPLLDGKYFYARVHKSTRAIKNILLDQSIIAGIGNIYADEILFMSQIHPLTQGNKITQSQSQNLVDVSRIVLKAAIKQGGTTIRSYTSSLNVTGLFQVALNAYGQEGKPCPRCQKAMKRIVISGRSSVFCESCQRRKQ